MEHYRLRKYRGPEVWARVREAYAAGEPGPQVAKRFDVGLANLRRKARREGWTRTATARAGDPLILATQPAVLGAAPAEARDHPGDADVAARLQARLDEELAEPVDPDDAMQDAIAQASSLLSQGRAAEATGLLKAAEGLNRAVGALGARTEQERAALAQAMWPMQQEWREAERARLTTELRAHLTELAQQMLRERVLIGAAQEWSLAAFHWRAATLGRDIAQSDHQHAQSGGWASRYWDEAGVLKPLG